MYWLQISLKNLPLTTHPAYDTIKLLAEKVLPQSINISDPASQLSKMKEIILGIKDYQGASGSITFDQLGAARIKESPWKLVNGQPEKIK